MQGLLAFFGGGQQLGEFGSLAQLDERGIGLQGGVGAIVPFDGALKKAETNVCLATHCHGGCHEIPAFRVWVRQCSGFLLVGNSVRFLPRGIVLARGGALLKNLDKRVRAETGLPVWIADDPLCSVVLGISKILSEFDLLRRVSIE